MPNFKYPTGYDDDFINTFKHVLDHLNNLGYTYEEAQKKADEILEKAKQTNDMNQSVQQQINTLIAESGTSDAELIQARIDAEGNEYPVLKDRLDAKEQQTKESLDEKADAKVFRYTEAELVQARFDEEGNEYPVLKDRLDTKERETKESLDEKADAKVFRYTEGGPSGSEDVFNVIQGYEGNDVVVGTRGAVIGGGGGRGYENVIGGFTDHAYAGDTTSNVVDPSITDAHYAAIPAGYNNVVNALAGVAIGYHTIIEKEATHGTILGGSKHQIVDGDYSIISGGTDNLIDARDGGSYSAIQAGQLNKLYGKYSVIQSGLYNRVGREGNQVEYSGIYNSYLSTVDGDYASVRDGYESKANADYSTARGKGAVANSFGESAFSTGMFRMAGDSVQSDLHALRQTTDGFEMQLLLDGEGQTITPVGGHTTMIIKAYISGHRVDAAGGASFEVSAHLSRREGNLTVDGLIVTPVYRSDERYSADVVVNNNVPQVRVQGLNGHTINWSASLHIVRSRDIVPAV